MKQTITIVVFTLTALICSLQARSESLWEGYPSLSEMMDIDIVENNVYGATSQGFFVYNKATQAFSYYYKNNGLDANELTAVNATNNYVYIGFKNNGLKRFDPNTGVFDAIQFPEYINTGDITKSLTINDIYAVSDTILYVAHEEGIDRLNLITSDLQTYYQLSPRFDRKIAVNKIEVFDGKIWACTGQGLAWADIDNPSLDLADAWDSFVFGRSYIPAAVTSILKHKTADGDSIIYIGTGSKGVIRFEPETGDTLTVLADTNIRHLASGFNTVIAASLYEGYFVMAGDEWVKNDSLKVFMRLVTDPDGDVWAATGRDGLQLITENGLTSIPLINLPSVPTIRDIEIASTGEIWISTSDRDQSGGHILTYNDDQWSSFSIMEPMQFRVTNGIALDTHDNLWGACWGTNLYTADISIPFSAFPESIVVIDPEREFILPYETGSNYIVNPDITVDENDNIWVAGYTNGLYVFDRELPIADNKYHNFAYDSITSDPLVMTVHYDSDDWVWLGTLKNGLIGQWVGSDPYNTSDDFYVHLTPDKLLGSRVNTVVTDLDGDVWVGTDGGLNKVKKLGGKKLDVTDESNLLDFNILNVLAVSVDGNGGKWIGTSDGLFRITRDNKQQDVYTTENSGLISNRILSLTYDPVGMRMLIGTDAGLNIFNVFKKISDAGDEVITVYPNPFEIWGSDSRATFEGLSEDELLRIFTATGELVIELEPESNNGFGADAVWDGRNYRGEYVGSGVYFYTGFVGDGNSKRQFRNKMVVIRR